MRTYKSLINFFKKINFEHRKKKKLNKASSKHLYKTFQYILNSKKSCKNYWNSPNFSNDRNCRSCEKSTKIQVDFWGTKIGLTVEPSRSSGWMIELRRRWRRRWLLRRRWETARRYTEQRGTLRGWRKVEVWKTIGGRL